MPLAPGMSNSLAIFARSVTLFSFSSARLMLMCLVPSIVLLGLKFRAKLRIYSGAGKVKLWHAGILLIVTGLSNCNSLAALRLLRTSFARIAEHLIGQT